MNRSIDKNLFGTPVYRACKRIADVMDSWYIDPIVGFVLPGIGDVILQLLNIPYIYITIAKLRSFELTLALVYNILIDILVGLFPVLGDICDVINKSYNKNINLITGYIEGDANTLRIVNRDSRIMVIIIIILILTIYAVCYILNMHADFVASLF